MFKKKLSKFYMVYFTLLIVFFVSLIIFLFALNSNLNKYNKGIPETVSEKFFTETFVNKDISKIVQMSDFSPCEFETGNDIINFVENQLVGDLTFTSVSNSGDKLSKKYIVKSGEYKLATFYIKPDKNDDYYVSSLDLHLPKNIEKQVTILDSSKLFVNGKEVDDKYIISSVPHEYSSFLPENVNAPTLVTYSITGLTKEPDMQIIDRNSNSPEIIEENGIYFEKIVYDPIENEVCSWLLEGAKKYAACMQNDMGKGRVFPYFEKGTDIYESLRTVETGFAWDHSGYSFENESVSEFMRYDENTVSVRITFTHVLKMYGRADFRDAIDITYFARNIDGVYKIFATHNN